MRLNYILGRTDRDASSWYQTGEKIGLVLRARYRYFGRARYRNNALSSAADRPLNGQLGYPL